jgi:hypothetical protein
MDLKLTHYQGVMEIKQYLDDYEKPKDENDSRTYSPRGEVNTLSRKSRRNLFNYVLRLQYRSGYYFVTLTYPKEYPQKFTIWKDNLKTLCSYLRYHFPQLGFLWKLEFQKRGAPHYHLLLFDPTQPDQEVLEEMITGEWVRIVKDYTKKFSEHSVDVKAVHDIKKSGFYLAIYQTKDGYIPANVKTGRHWGIFGRKQMPITEQGKASLSVDQYRILKRVCRKWVQKQKNSQSYANYLCNPTGSFSIFMPNHEQIRLMEWVASTAEV